MPVVDSVNYITKRIFLHSDTVGVDLDTMDIYREVRALRRTNENDRKFERMIVAGGNIEKIAGVSFTPSYVQLLNGCRIVPYDTTQSLKVVRDTFTDDGFAGRDCFDRSSLSAGTEVDIDVDFPEIETRVVDGTGGASAQDIWEYVLEGGLTAEQVQRLLLAVAAGKSTDSGGTVTFRDQADTKDRISATVSNGVRTAVTVDAT